MSTTEIEYVPRELFDSRLQNITDTISYDRDINRVEKNLAVIQGQVNILGQKIDNVEERLSKKFDVLDKKIDTVEERLNRKVDILDKKIDNVEKRLNAKIDNVEERLNAKIDRVEEKLNAKIDGVEERLTEKIEHVADKLSVAIDETNKRIDDQQHYMNVWFAVLAAIPVAIAIVQYMLSK